VWSSHAAYPVQLRDDMNGLVPLESVLRTEQLHQRPSRPADHATENRALSALVQALADSPSTILQKLTDTVLEVLKAGSAGISLLSRDGQAFKWPAVSGVWQPHVGRGTPRDFGPCGNVLDANSPLLFAHPEQRYPYLQAATPLIDECLLVPFSVDGKAIGTIWAITHEGDPNGHQFDAEDLRQLESLGRFASAAYQAGEAQGVDDALRESEAFNRSIVESSSDCIKVLDLTGHLLSFRCGQELLGIEDVQPYLHTSWIDFWEGGDRQAAQAAVAMAAAGRVGTFVGFFRTLRNEPKWWEVKISPILDANRQPHRLLAVSRDVTVQQRTVVNLEFLASVSQDLVRWTNVDEMMATVGARLAAHLGLSICAFVDINESAEQVVVSHDWHRADVPGLVGTYRLAEFVEDEFIRAARAGEIIVVRNTATDPRTSVEKFAALKIASFVCVPLIRDGQWRFALCLYHSELYDWRDDEIELIRELTLRIWTRLENLRAHAALRLSEERLRALVTASSDMVYRMSPDWSEMRHLRGQDFIVDTNQVNSSWLEQYIPADDQPMVKAAINEAIRTKTTFELEHRVWQVDGSVGWTSSHAVPLLAATGEVVEWFGAASDVTERNNAAAALRESEERYRTLFNSMDEGYCVIEVIFDAQQRPIDFRYLEANPAFEKQTGLHGITGKRIREVVPDLDEYWFDTYGKVATTGEPVRFLNEARAMNRWFDFYAFRIGEPNSHKIAVVFSDATERTLSADKTREQAEALVDLHRRKDEFLAMLSHELRSPLAPIANAVHLLGLQKHEEPLQMQARLIIERQVAQLKHLVDDLLEVSRITTGRILLRHEQVVVSGIVERAVETTQMLIEQRRHLLTVTLSPEPLWLHADAARIEQVVVNLLANAAKYTDEGGGIWLSVEQEGNEAVLRVRDTGVGIAPELLPRIFDLFAQADRALDRSQGGLGIGLCLVQRLVELHGGTVAAHSVVGQGSEFVVRLPVGATVVRPPSGSPLETGPGGQRHRVLLVDDSVDTADSMAMLLNASGHDVRVAHDGPTALHVAEDYRPDVVILDIGLPGLNGYEVAQQVRQHPLLGGVMLIAMTGYGQESDRQRAVAAGFDHHLVKPVNFATVQRLLSAIPIAGAADRAS